MALLIKPGRDAAENWIKTITAAIPDLDCRIWPDIGDPEEVKYVLANELPDDAFAQFPNLKFVAGTAVGVERILKNKSLPADIPVIRAANPERAATMTGWALHHVLRHHRHFAQYEENQTAKVWEHLKYLPPEDVRIGVMGLGNLGGTVARTLVDLRYDVAGWARSKKDIPGIESFAGTEAFEDFLKRSDIVISILPNTKGTFKLLNRERLALLPKGAYVINAGRGTLLDETALMEAIDSGALSGAALDVLEVEPPADDHPFWDHPKITLTPHYACAGRAVYGAQVIIDAIKDMRAGKPLARVVDKSEGY